MKKKTTKRTRRKKRQEHCTYAIEILDWEMPYSFHLTRNENISPGPYWEYAALSVRGRLLEPAKLVGREIEATILGERRKIPVLEKPEDYDFKPLGVGGLTIRGKQSEFLGGVPFDVLALLATLLQAGRITTLILNGPTLYRGYSHIDSMNFEKEYRPEDYA